VQRAEVQEALYSFIYENAINADFATWVTGSVGLRCTMNNCMALPPNSLRPIFPSHPPTHNSEVKTSPCSTPKLQKCNTGSADAIVLALAPDGRRCKAWGLVPTLFRSWHLPWLHPPATCCTLAMYMHVHQMVQMLQTCWLFNQSINQSINQSMLHL
jgi:hypothetical protein